MDPEHARQMALKCRREDDTTTALLWFRRIKEIGNNTASTKNNNNKSANNNMPSSKATNTVSIPAPVSVPVVPKRAALSPDEAFDQLEHILRECEQKLVNEAKKLKQTDAKAAVLLYKKSKEYTEDLKVLHSRRGIPNYYPPLYRWEVIKKEEMDCR